MTLASASPWDLPIANPGILSSAFDKFTIRESIKATKRMVAAPAWANYVLGPYGDLATAETDAELDAYAAKNTASFNHPLGTAAMGPYGPPAYGKGAVNPDLTVKGVRGLRVVDGSILVSPLHLRGDVIASHRQTPFRSLQSQQPHPRLLST